MLEDQLEWFCGYRGQSWTALERMREGKIGSLLLDTWPDLKILWNDGMRLLFNRKYKQKFQNGE